MILVDFLFYFKSFHFFLLNLKSKPMEYVSGFFYFLCFTMFSENSYSLKMVPDSIPPNATLEVLKEHFNKKGIYIRLYPELNLVLLKYKRKFCDITDTEVRRCRGLIVDYTTYEPVCVPPGKSIPFDDFKVSYGSQEDTIRYEEFLDGTMMNLFYHNSEKYSGWLISTRSCIGANCKWYSNREFKDLFEESINFTYDVFDKDTSYTFVLQHPENRIVKKLDAKRVVLVEANRINKYDVSPLNLTEVQLDFFQKGLNIEIPVTQPFKTIHEATQALSKLSYEEQGWVLKYNHERTKMRNPRWRFVKDLRGNSNSLLRNYLELRQNGFMRDYLDFFPEMEEQFKGFMNDLHELTRNLFQNYQACFVKKTKKHSDVPFIYKPLCYELHKNYLENQVIVTFQEAKHFMNTMPIARQMFLFRNKNKEYLEQEVED